MFWGSFLYTDMFLVFRGVCDGLVFVVPADQMGECKLLF